ncbi:hypothetical protein AB2B41_04310 [Marimonas sp. MJW-29]|uniref:Uncharacterized protein n=1 Tax=Sulfitobacter sediminis TaxID=3234186 RepID=A0ABV3RIM2_9RHOB
MGDKPEEEVVKKFELELETFGKRNKQKFSLIGDLSLCMRTCKTPEVDTSLREMMRKAVAELNKDMLTTQQRIQQQIEQAAKKAEKEKKAGNAKAAKKASEDAKLAKQTKAKLKLKFDKFSKKYLPSDNTFFLEFQPKTKSEFPFFDVKKSFLFLGTTF